MPKCPLTSVPGYEESQHITNPGLEVKINQVFDETGQINLPFNRNQWMELYRETPKSPASYFIMNKIRNEARRHKIGKNKKKKPLLEGVQQSLPMGRKEWYDLYGKLPKTKKSKELFQKLTDSINSSARRRPKYITEDGYVFTVMDDGTVTDGDNTYSSLEDFQRTMEEEGINIYSYEDQHEAPFGLGRTKKADDSRRMSDAVKGILPYNKGSSPYFE